MTVEKYIDMKFEVHGTRRNMVCSETHVWYGFSKNGALFCTPFIGKLTINMDTGLSSGVRKGWSVSPEDKDRLHRLRVRGRVFCVYGDWSAPNAVYVHIPYDIGLPRTRAAVDALVARVTGTKQQWWFMPAHVTGRSLMLDYAASSVFPHFQWVDGELVSCDKSS